MPSLAESHKWMVDKCNADNVGYSQDYRYQQTVNGITYYDCSSMIWYALLAGGFDVVGASGSSYAFTTRSMGAVLEALGFTKLPALVEWQMGDIVWRTGHTEMVFVPDITMGAHTDSYALADQVSINKYNATKSSWEYVYRYGEIIPDNPEPDTPNTRKKMPLWMMCRGF